jgi:hypothetical protein
MDVIYSSICAAATMATGRATRKLLAVKPAAAPVTGGGAVGVSSPLPSVGVGSLWLVVMVALPPPMPPVGAAVIEEPVAECVGAAEVVESLSLTAALYLFTTKS